MKQVIVIWGLILAVPHWAGAQEPDAPTREVIERLMKRIDTLEQRIADLEKAQAAARAPAPPTPKAVTVQAGPPPGAGATHTHDQAPAAETPEESAAQPVYPSLKISGFGDIDFSASDLHGASGGFGAQTLLAPHSGFEEGQFVLHLSSALSPKVTVFSELSLTARSDAGIGTPPAPGFNPEVERLILRYDFNDYVKISAGRYHTPINYWNTEFHHGQWLQTTISRPEMVQFGGNFIPVHFVGTLVEGAAPAGGLNLNYNVGLGNGRGQVISRPGDFSDINNNRAWLVDLFVKPDALYGLQTGGAVYRDEMTPASGLRGREWIESGHVVWQKENPEFLAEFANVHHAFAGGVNANSQAFYVQVADRLPWFNRLWKPYYRFEQIHVPKSDPLFRGLVPTFSASTVGVRYDFTTFAAWKVEYRNYQRRDLPAINGIFTQTSFTF
ncbi:MAG TPA: hypothetical protein VJ732_04615 [Bryobacteraceae bacterium]|nr:hypothetical protein [Bryobacteraceae bacterium]